MSTKECVACLEQKTLDNFYLIKGTPRSKCKVCYSKGVNSNPNHKISSLKYYYKNTEKCNARHLKNYIKHRTGVALCY